MPYSVAIIVASKSPGGSPILRRALASTFLEVLVAGKHSSDTDSSSSGSTTSSSSSSDDSNQKAQQQAKQVVSQQQQQQAAIAAQQRAMANLQLQYATKKLDIQNNNQQQGSLGSNGLLQALLLASLFKGRGGKSQQPNGQAITTCQPWAAGAPAILTPVSSALVATVTPAAALPGGTATYVPAVSTAAVQQSAIPYVPATMATAPATPTIAVALPQTQQAPVTTPGAASDDSGDSLAQCLLIFQYLLPKPDFSVVAKQNQLSLQYMLAAAEIARGNFNAANLDRTPGTLNMC